MHKVQPDIVITARLVLDHIAAQRGSALAEALFAQVSIAMVAGRACQGKHAARVHVWQHAAERYQSTI